MIIQKRKGKTDETCLEWVERGWDLVYRMQGFVLAKNLGSVSMIQERKQNTESNVQVGHKQWWR